MNHMRNQQASPKTRCLRIVFGDAIVTRDISADATYEDIARTLSKLSIQRYGSPLEIYATIELAPPAGLLH